MANSNVWMTDKLPDVSGEESLSVQMTFNCKRQLFETTLVIKIETDHCIVYFVVGLLSVNILYLYPW